MLAIVLELQAHRWRRAEDLARVLETSKRTIYRDLEAMGRAGVPLISTPGRGYTLVEGYFLPPVSFTADEATILSLGADVMAQSFDAQYRAAAESAASKITAALPERLRVDVAALRERILVGPEGEALRPEGAATLRALRGAVIACQRVRFRYHTRYPASGGTGDEPLWREADPYALIRVRGAWYSQRLLPPAQRPAQLPPGAHRSAGPARPALHAARRPPVASPEARRNGGLRGAHSVRQRGRALRRANRPPSSPSPRKTRRMVACSSRCACARKTRSRSGCLAGGATPACLRPPRCASASPPRPPRCSGSISPTEPVSAIFLRRTLRQFQKSSEGSSISPSAASSSN